MRLPRFTPWLVVATLVAAGAAAAAGYGLTAPKRYRATAEILVSPVSAADSTLAGLDLFRDANGRHTAAESAAVLVRTPQVADAVRAQLGLRQSRDSLLAAIDTDVPPGSDVVRVTGHDTSGSSAAQLANAFVDALIAQRTASFQSRLASAVAHDTDLLRGATAGLQASELARRLAVLRSLQGEPDPSVRRASTAVAPAAASWPNVWAFVLIGAGAGLLIGALVAPALLLLRRRPTPYDPPVEPRSSDHAVEALVDRLEQRLAARESALAARERDLQARIDELRALERAPAAAERDDDLRLAERERALADRERLLEERIAAVQERELALARAAASAPPPPELPQPARPQPAELDGGSGFNLAVLERLVTERGAAHPERLEEWQSYLFFLRDHASSDGKLPHSLDALVEETFRPIL